MSYWKTSSGKDYKSLDNYSKNNNNSKNNEFYEFEAAIVLDIILDENHEIFKKIESTKIDTNRWPADLEGKPPLSTDVDYSWIGRALIRLVNTQKKIEKEHLTWAYPLEKNISEYPILNEIVAVVKYMGKVYYTRNLNCNNFANTNEKFDLEPLIGGFFDKSQKGNRELNESATEYIGPKSISRFGGGYGYEGVCGRYFLLNKNIRSIKRFEGDLLIESRFGQSIRFASYDKNRNNDKSDDSLKDYKTDGTINPVSNLLSGGGNPMIVIRNRQRPTLKEGQIFQKSPLPPIVGTSIEKNVGGIIEEDINYDGSTIAITSGLTITKWATTCFKKMFQSGLEEQSNFSPDGSTNFTYPVLNGDQIVINSDRIILSSRWNEMFQYSKKRFGIVTDSEYTVDAQDQIILTTNTKTVLNSPSIYLGQYNEDHEPVLLGKTTIDWLYNLCNILLAHTLHYYNHSHPNTGAPDPIQTQLTVQQQALISLRDSLETLLSKRVFVTGGGFPGSNGGQI